MTPTLVLTRPEAQSREIAAAVGDRVPVIVSPIMRIEPIEARPDFAHYAGLVLTSANALTALTDLNGIVVYCVGKRTAQAAQNRGAEVRLIARDADDLVARIEGAGPLLHARGEHARGAVAKRLNSAGLETEEAVVYRQIAQPLTDAARAAIKAEHPVVLPLYSPRSAKLVGGAIREVGPQVHVIAMSPAVAKAWAAVTGGDAEICASPTGEDMLIAIKTALRC